MKKEARLLKARAVDSLLLAIEQFNRPWDRGRLESVLMLLDHSFEMLLKAGLIHKGACIRERRAKQTLGFDACVRKALSDSSVRFLTDEQAITLQMINAQRDAAQHYLLEMSEEQLYMHTQAGVTLFADVLKKLFGLRLQDFLPERVMPVSTRPPRDLATLMDDEVRTISALIKPGSRKRVEARSRARSLAIMEGAVTGERVQPGKGELDKILKKVG
ncbi:MAG: hypothetical protein M3285_00990 [Actinomycetota bacterium]|nr:hypothetical protein [Actinomycetota bacterium]MDQ3954111.1 hypothetical protein [Actinomycetota bacterium]